MLRLYNVAFFFRIDLEDIILESDKSFHLQLQTYLCALIRCHVTEQKLKMLILL